MTSAPLVAESDIWLLLRANVGNFILVSPEVLFRTFRQEPIKILTKLLSTTQHNAFELIPEQFLKN
jgi:hypothetical protein